MNQFLKIGHLVGLAVFVGSIPAHIVLGHLVDPATDLLGFATLMQAKYMTILVLTAPGLVLALLTGTALMLRRGMTPNRFRWMAVKLVLVGLITLNGTLFLTPLARDISAVARAAVSAGALPTEYADLARREAAFGAANLAMILAVIGLVVSKPALRPNLTKTHGTGAVL